MKANDLKKGHNLLLFNINSCSAENKEFRVFENVHVLMHKCIWDFYYPRGLPIYSENGYCHRYYCLRATSAEQLYYTSRAIDGER